MHSFSIAKKVYFLLVFLFTVPVLVFGFINARDTRTTVEAETRQTLFEIVSALQQKLPNDYDELLAKIGYQYLNEDEKIIILRRILQPIVDDLVARYPGFAMGYGTYNQRIAGHPYAAGRTAEIGKAVYKKKSLSMYTNSASPSWDYVAGMGVSYPLFLNGQVYGHVWASAKLENVSQVFWQSWSLNGSVFLVSWLGLLLTMRYAFRRMKQGLEGLVGQIRGQNEKPIDMHEFPELLPVLETVTELRHGWQEEKQRVVSILDSISDMFFAMDRELRLTYMNPKAREFFLLTEDQTGHYFCNVFPKARNREIHKAMLSALAENRRIELDTVSSATLPDLWYNVRIYPAADGLTLLLTDVTERKLMQDKQSETNKHLARLEELNVVSKIAASISHEVRNPMTTVRGYLQYLSTKKDSAALKSYFDLMIDELDRANSIIGDFLSVAKKQSDNKQVMNLNCVLRTVRPLLESDALKIGHDIKFTLGEIPDVQMSSNEMRQLILNLTRNAFEAMDKRGAVHISTYAEQEQVVLAIRDNGPGIAKTVLDKLGIPFTTTKSNGTGLGLSVCYSIAERHNGKIDVDTSEQGTTFYVRLALAGQ